MCLQSNSYQGVLITDGSNSYALFIYECGLLQGGSIAGIGYYISSDVNEAHPLSNSVLASTIACLPSDAEGNVVTYSLFWGTWDALVAYDVQSMEDTSYKIEQFVLYTF